jgi:hypothetical protein
MIRESSVGIPHTGTPLSFISVNSGENPWGRVFQVGIADVGNFHNQSLPSINARVDINAKFPLYLYDLDQYWNMPIKF